MGYQEMILKTRYKAIPKIEKLLKINKMDLYIDLVGYYIEPTGNKNPKIYVVFAGDRHPGADFVAKLGAKPIESMFKELTQKIWTKYEYISMPANAELTEEDIF